MMNFIKILLVAAVLIAAGEVIFAEKSKDGSEITIMIPTSAWRIRIGADDAIIGYGSGTFETARVERPNLLRAICKEIEPAIEAGSRNVPLGAIVGTIEVGDKIQKFYIKDETVIKNIIDVLSADWRPASEARFAEILAKKPIFKDWTPSPERGKDISSKMSW